MQAKLYTSILTAALSAGALTAQAGTFTTSGVGCPTTFCSTNAIYEVMAAGTWDLDNTAITFTRATPTYLAIPGGTMIPLNAPTTVGPTDDSVTGPFALGFTFNYEGGLGSTTAVDVSSNGYVYLEPGTIGTSRCCSGSTALPGFLADTPSIAALGTDLNPAQGGAVHYQTVTATNPINSASESVFVVEWNAVPEYFNTASNTVQCQLWQSGEVVIVHGATSGAASTHDALVGISTGGGQTECGPGIDFTTALPFIPAPPFGRDDPITLSLTSGSPNLGSTMTIGAANLTPGTTAGVLHFALGQVQIPLSSIGLPPGCELLVDPTIATAPMTVTAPTADVSFTVSSSPTTLGIGFETQAFFADPTRSHPIPVFVSDRATFAIGSFNDDCSSASPITDGLTSGSNANATTSTTTGSCGLMGNDVWYLYVATCTGTATVSFCAPGSSRTFDTVLAAFDGSCGALTQIVCNDDSCGLGSEISFPTTVGNLYYIAVGSFNASTGGAFTVSVTCQ